MAETPRISEAEWEVMEAVWADPPATAVEIVSRLSRRHDWKEQTIRTMLTRLVKKGALTLETEGKHNLYRPALSREKVVRGVSRSFFSRVVRGAAAPVLVELVRESRLSADEIEELRKVLLQKKEGKKP